ncbi:MAG: thioredoxin [bacterium]|nr:MAG: thioredoxin [bacterium]
MAINLTTDNFTKLVLKSKVLVLVEFYAEWSGSSHILTPMLKTIEEMFQDNVLFCKLNIDQEKDIAEHYGITDIPTILIFNNSKVVDCLQGIFPGSVLEHKLNELIKNENKTL